MTDSGPAPAPHLTLYAAVCRRHGWRFELLDRHSGHLARISDGRRHFLVAGGRACVYPLNAASAVDVARDKAHTLGLLAELGVAVPRGACFFLRAAHRSLRGPDREAADAVPFARGLGYPVCVKPNDGARGHLVDYAYDDVGLRRQLAAIAQVSHAALVQEVVEAAEYRLFLLDGRIRFAYRRHRLQVAGDGRSTAADLLSGVNRRLAERGLSPIEPRSPFLLRALAQRGLALHDIVPAGMSFAPAPRGNLSAGGRLAEYREQAPNAVADWGTRIADAIGLRVAAIDLFARAGADEPGGFVALEVNGNPSLGGIAAAGHGDTACDILADVCRAALHG